ncbi:MAG: transketolase [Synergistaceae bacterium]|jgi:transketolase|nr:transketolase [Synergistaceae bacterium]
MADRDVIAALELTAARCRRGVVRMVRSGGAGHMGGAMSCIDIVTALYFHTLDIDPRDPKKPDRDRFILSAGHKCLAQYAVLAERGYFDPSLLDTYGKLNTKLPGHPDMHKLPGIEANTGALGHGLSISAGMALGLRDTHPTARVFAVMGDGELPEGSNWEAVSAASFHHLDKLTVFVDCNGLQISGRTCDVMNMEPIAERFASFGWAVREIDGNDMTQIIGVLDNLPLETGRPSAVIARTVKGRGLSFAENQAVYHYWKPAEEELSLAERELDEAIRVREAM